MTRTLSWGGLENVRDLGGLATDDGGMTQFGVIVRADNVRRLRSLRTLVDHGVSRVVDLRFPAERDEDGLDTLPFEVVHVSLLGEWDDDYREALGARMLRTEAVVSELERRHGSVRAYLVAAGVSPEALHGLRARLRGDGVSRT